MTEEIKITTKIEKDQVMKVYNGEAHKCMCGCSGTYKYASDSQEAGTLDRGYDVTDDEISDRSITRAVNKINRAMEAGETIMGVNEGTIQYAYIESGSRITTAYMK